ncbi:hypothetical protein RND81_14G124200 [Saponaria officinalis]|uniref:Uncharacterized protein n=1 Tax=Saponaria officinalis TaxID=3572 RepID=A0AAW1GPQ1_SAPOF
MVRGGERVNVVAAAAEIKKGLRRVFNYFFESLDLNLLLLFFQGVIEYVLGVDAKLDYLLWFHFVEMDPKTTKAGHRVFDLLDAWDGKDDDRKKKPQGQYGTRTSVLSRRLSLQTMILRARRTNSMSKKLRMKGRENLKQEKMVAALITSGASALAVTDPSSYDPTGRNAAYIAAASGHKGLTGYPSKVALTSHLSSHTVKETELSKGTTDVEAELTVNNISNERAFSPVTFTLSEFGCIITREGDGRRWLSAGANHGF